MLRVMLVSSSVAAGIHSSCARRVQPVPSAVVKAHVRSRERTTPIGHRTSEGAPRGGGRGGGAGELELAHAMPENISSRVGC